MWQHLRSYQDGFTLVVTVRTHVDFIMLPHWKNQTVGIMTRCPTQPYYPNAVITSPLPIVVMSSTKLDSDMYQFYKSSVCLSWWKIRYAPSVGVNDNHS